MKWSGFGVNGGRKLKGSLLVGILLVSLSLVFFGVSQPSSAATSPVFVQIRGIGSYGYWYPQDQSPAKIISDVQGFSTATGRPVDVLLAVSGPQDPGQVIKGTSSTVDGYLSSLKTASGGDIIPTLNLMYYTSGEGLTVQSYCDPHNSTNCGPKWFWEVSSELLSLKAVQAGSKTVLLDAFDQFSRYTNPSTVKGVLSKLLTEGWNHIIVKQVSNGYLYPDYGYATYEALTISCTTVAPYCSENQAQIKSLYKADGTSLKGVIGFFDYQIINSPQAQTGLNVYLANFTATRQLTALTNLASSQATEGFSLAYPLVTGDARNNVFYYWDSCTLLKPTGNPFVLSEESLVTTYP